MDSSSDIFNSGFVALIGAPNVGKSTLMNAVVGEKIAIVTHKPQTTRNRILGICTKSDCQIIFVDTPGILNDYRSLFAKQLHKISFGAVAEVDAIVGMFSADKFSVSKNEKMLDAIKTSPAKTKLFVINKIDKVVKSKLLPMIAELHDLGIASDIIPVSVKQSDGIEELMALVSKKLPEGPLLFPEDMMTDQSERFLTSEVIREQILLQLHEEVPYSVYIEVLDFKERDHLISIHANINVDRESHKSILIGKGGKMIRQIGVDSRKFLEGFFNKKIHIDLNVKLKQNWTKDSRLLKDFGWM